jgi:aminoglycoside phosphotransferase (APT) family kinase protein
MPDRSDALAAALGALGLPDDADVAAAADGASGSAWRVNLAEGAFVIRFAGSATIARSRLASMAAASAADLPVPEVVRAATSAHGEVVLLRWLPGVSLLDAVSRAPSDTMHYATQMGGLHRRLHAIAAPPDVVRVTDDRGRPFNAGRDVAGLPRGDRLLHLDWHPLNLVVDESAGEIIGIIDWDNARAGDPSLDLARTRSILTLEPGLEDLPRHVRDRLPELLDGWADGYGAEARAIPQAAEVWACRVMLADLAPRYGDRPEALDGIRARIDAAARDR